MNPHLLLSASWKVITTIMACMLVPGSMDLLVLSVSALFRPKPAVLRETDRSRRYAVVIPAHNEETSIKGCVQSLFESCSHAAGVVADIFVIADNCSDCTAEIARLTGAIVLERTNLLDVGKGHALYYAFSHLLELGYNGVMVVDADTQVSVNFIADTTAALEGGSDAVQARYLVSNANDTNRTRLMSFALRAFNVVRPLGRDNLGLSCGIFGNGFGLSSRTLLKVPYLASSLVEDLEYHLSLVRSGRSVRFLNDVVVLAEMPIRTKAIKSQRSRWEGGRLRMLFAHGPSLLLDVLTGKLHCLEPLLELLLLPLAFHTLLVLVTLSSRVPLVHDVGIIAGLIVVGHLAVTIAIGGEFWSDLSALVTVPGYVLWKIWLVPSVVLSARAKKRWVRTDRNAESAPSDIAR
jgi:cellulose synthase/poly-beta-1,6-N-acetylglucosamine synthase-like glycosyltransferase